MKGTGWIASLVCVYGLLSAQLHAAEGYTRNPQTGIVLDNSSGLQWQDDYDGDPATLGDFLVTKMWLSPHKFNAGEYANTEGDSAANYCQNLKLGGFQDWRLPSLDELKSLVDTNYRKPSLFMDTLDDIPNNGFVHAASYYFWSSESDSANPMDALTVRFKKGAVRPYRKNNNSYVRCVRSE